MLKLSCKLGWHNWTDWSEAVKTNDGNAVQVRICKNCKRAEHRWI